jgi:hypothetical protein
MFSLVKIRIKQLFRILKDLGFIRSIVVFFIISLGILALIDTIKSEKYQGYVIAGYCIMLFSIQIRRKDKSFIFRHLNQPNIKIFMEYFIFSLPILIVQIIFNPFVSILLIIFLFLLSFFNLSRKRSTINSYLIRKIPHKNFEWISGIRKNYYLLLFTYLISILTSFTVFSTPICVTVITIIIMGFFDECEPRQFVEFLNLPPAKFLYNKFLSSIHIYLLIIIPLLICYTLFNLNLWYISLFLLLNSIITLIYSISIKYSAFSIIRDSYMNNPVLKGLGAVNLILPFALLPLIIVMIVYLNIKSLNNLKPVLNDYN